MRPQLLAAVCLVGGALLAYSAQAGQAPARCWGLAEQTLIEKLFATQPGLRELFQKPPKAAVSLANDSCKVPVLRPARWGRPIIDDTPLPTVLYTSAFDHRLMVQRLVAAGIRIAAAEVRVGHKKTVRNKAPRDPQDINGLVDKLLIAETTPACIDETARQAARGLLHHRWIAANFWSGETRRQDEKLDFQKWCRELRTGLPPGWSIPNNRLANAFREAAAKADREYTVIFAAVAEQAAKKQGLISSR